MYIEEWAHDVTILSLGSFGIISDGPPNVTLARNEDAQSDLSM